MMNAKFHTIGCIAQFEKETTKKIAARGFVKIGFKICPARRSVNVIQCTKCYHFGHFEKDLDKREICKSENQICNHCSGKHHEEQCNKKNSEPRCVNCNGKHKANDRRCIKREEKFKILLSKCSC
jgi:hypothetical protein